MNSNINNKSRGSFRNFFKRKNRENKPRNKDWFDKNKQESKTFSYKTSIKYEPITKKKDSYLNDDQEELRNEYINNIGDNKNNNIEFQKSPDNFLINKESEELTKDDTIFNNMNFKDRVFETNKSNCSICGKVVFDKSSAFLINDEKGEELICFECAKNQIEKKYNISQRNKIIYLGAGTFGEIRQIKGEKGFVILRRFKFCSPKHEKFSNAYLPDNIEEIK
ncbi:MAG: hypothetical protein N3A58_01145 [Spirochaetes bacterium]|nr:hypothetical protein [Spirochaetota bacterium]